MGLIPIAGIANTVLGAYETWAGLKGLRNLEKNKPQGYTISPELNKSYQRAESMTGTGFSGAEKGAFQSRVATDQNTIYGSAVQQAGGNLAQTIAMGLQGQKIQAENTFAADDASLRRENIKYADSLMKDIQSQKNLATEQKLNEYQQKEAAYGGAVKAGLENIGGAFNLTQVLGGGTGLPGIGNRTASSANTGITSTGADPNFGFQLDGLSEDQARTAYESHQDPRVKARLEELYPFLVS